MNWYVYSGAAAAKNFSIAMREGVWGAKRSYFSELASGDKLIFFHAISSDRKPSPKGFPKFCKFDDFTGIVESVVEVKLTSDPYLGEKKIWDDDIYPHRFNFEIVGRVQKFELNQLSISDSIRECIHSSLKYRSKPFQGNDFSINQKLPEPFNVASDEDPILTEQDDGEGTVYIIVNEYFDNWVKIGCSKNLPLRERNYQTYSPGKYLIHAFFVSEECFDSEQKIHGELRANLNFTSVREWHNITKEAAVAFIEELYPSSVLVFPS
jgi:hypothetical protein